MNDTRVISAKPSSLHEDIQEIWRFRHLIYFFAWRDFILRYKQAFFGLAWAFFQPIVATMVFVIVFRSIAGENEFGIPYIIFVYSGILFWFLFSNSVNDAANSLVKNSHIIEKVYFPLIVVPSASVLIYIADFLCSLILFAALLLWYQVSVSIVGILLLPVLLLLTMLISAGLGYFLSAVTVKYRDVKFILPFFLQFIIFLSPILYGTTSSAAHPLFYINPMTSVIELVRNAFFTGHVSWVLLGGAMVYALALFCAGALFMKKQHASISDII